jgi:SAM-dependent methyltransferase
MTSEDIVESLLAVAAGDADRAARSARAASSGSSPSRLATALLRYLEGGEGNVYREPSAFERFIDGGGNVALYREARTALAALHERDRPSTVLDVGCGDGRLTAAALQPALTRLDLVEPSDELLRAAQARLAGQAVGVTVVAHGSTAQAFVDAMPHQRWDVAQSTFALHAVAPTDRPEVLGMLARTVGRLLIIEFDVPSFPDRGVEHARYAAERYEIGVAEYEDEDRVVDGFLVPVLVGQFDPGRPRHTWEQPIDTWVADLRASGFTEVDRRPVSDYWWAPAHLIEATGVSHP